MDSESRVVVDDVALDFLTLVRDYYHITDQANYFLEGRTGESGINIAIANQRDVLSHLVTLLSNGNLTDEERRGQLANAEEHLRRSIVEPYQRAVEVKRSQFKSRLEEYQKDVMPLIGRGDFALAPNMIALNAKDKECLRLYAEGRRSKHRNLWDDQWNEGVVKFEQSFEIIEQALIEVEKFIALARHKTDHRRDNVIKWSGWAIGFIALVIAVVQFVV